jgi:acyl-lipid omega-6 desaturase (Delta-12 desaturase)
LGVLLSDLLIAGLIAVAALTIGWRTYILVQLPVIWLAGAAGIWLFYVQHQFAGVYWARAKAWKRLRAAMEGSSYYRLPNVLRWFSGNIGFHHVHHLVPRIPNYRLKACYDAIPALQSRAPLTIAESLGCMRLKVWDEEQQKMVSFH